jgi:hypothetical protein
MIKFNISDKVALARHVVARTGHNKIDADARGRVVAVEGAVVAVDFAGTWKANENGGTVRCLPAFNLTKILANGVIYE